MHPPESGIQVYEGDGVNPRHVASNAQKFNAAIIRLQTDEVSRWVSLEDREGIRDGYLQASIAGLGDRADEVESFMRLIAGQRLEVAFICFGRSESVSYVDHVEAPWTMCSSSSRHSLKSTSDSELVLSGVTFTKVKRGKDLGGTPVLIIDFTAEEIWRNR